MTNVKHTDAPWALGEENVGGGFNIYAGNLRIAHTSIQARVTKPDTRPIGEDEAKANAAFIVKAVNSYEPMLDALKKLTAEMVGIGGFGPEIRELVGNTNWAVLTQRVQEARAAIAKAEGRS